MSRIIVHLYRQSQIAMMRPTLMESTDQRTKILCVCQKGNSRSVALAWLLKMKYRQDALAMGIRTSAENTKKLLYEWADVIILTSNRYIREIPEEYLSKLKVWHVGTDIWFQGFASDLINKFEEYIQKGDWITADRRTNG